MADIKKELNDIKTAIYGKDVRGSIHDGIDKINKESEDSKQKASEAHDVMESIINDGFDNAALEANFEQRLDDEIGRLQPEWTQFQTDVTSQLNEIAVNVDSLGADNTGTNDSYDAFFKAINSFPDATAIEIMMNAGTYRLSKPLFFTRAVIMRGKGKDRTFLDFSSATEKANAPYNSFLTVVHGGNTVGGSHNPENPIILPDNQIGIDGRYTVLDDFTVIGNPDATTEENGIVINAPSELNRVGSNLHSGYGVMILANTIKDNMRIRGIANQTRFKNVIAKDNKKDGIIAWGDDANTFLWDNCTSYANGGWGFYDKSLLGGVLIGTECDNNKTGGYGADASTPSRTMYFGTYCEGNQPILYQVAARSFIVGATGARPDPEQPYIGNVTNTGPVSYRPMNVAKSDQSAYDLGGDYDTASRLSDDKLQIRARIDKDLFAIQSDINFPDNYLAMLMGDIRSFLLPFKDVNPTLIKGRPYFPIGVALGDRVSFEEGISAPTSGTYELGNTVWNRFPSRTKNISHWTCRSAGTPGVWSAHGTGWGATAERPTLGTNDAGYSYYDTTLSKMVLWNGTSWLE